MPWETEPGAAKGQSPKLQVLSLETQNSEHFKFTRFEFNMSCLTPKGSAPQVAKAEPAKQRMPLETERAAAKGHGLRMRGMLYMVQCWPVPPPLPPCDSNPLWGPWF